MPLDPVPYFTGGGAQHSPEVMRTLAYASTGGKRGTIGPADVKVQATSTPGSTVTVSTGAVVIPSRNATGANQSYVARMNTAETVAIAPTTSSGPRRDLVVIQIEDPWVSGEPWQAPANPATGPYVFTRVISNVPAGTTDINQVSGYEGRTAITLARIDLPASTGTITNAMITDLRRIANPRSERVFFPATPTTANVTLDSGNWKAFPTTPITNIAIPSWATHAAIRVDTTVLFVSGDGYANFQAFLGPAGQIDNTTLFTDLQIDSTTVNTSSRYRQPLIMPSNGLWAIPPALRGTTAQISSRVRAINTSGGVIATSANDYYFADITFMERSV